MVKKLQLHRTPESAAALLAERCYRDRDFREKFTRDPKGVIAEHSEAAIPSEMKVVLCQNDEKNWYIPIPPPSEENQPLSETQLDKVAAGEVVSALVIIGGIGVAAIVAGGISAGLALGVNQ